MSAKPVKEALKALGWDISHPPYSPDLAPCDYQLFALMGYALAEQHFANFEEVSKWLDEWFCSKDKQFFWDGIHKLPVRWTCMYTRLYIVYVYRKVITGFFEKKKTT